MRREQYALQRMSSSALTEVKKHGQVFAKENAATRWSDLNRDFHRELYEQAQMPYHLQAVVEALEKTERTEWTRCSSPSMAASRPRTSTRPSWRPAWPGTARPRS